jgi:hypothetical protein
MLQVFMLPTALNCGLQPNRSSHHPHREARSSTTLKKKNASASMSEGSMTAPVDTFVTEPARLMTMTPRRPAAVSAPSSTCEWYSHTCCRWLVNNAVLGALL